PRSDINRPVSARPDRFRRWHKAAYTHYPRSAFSWRRLFLLTDRLLHIYQSIGITPLRSAAISACVEWVVRHQDADGCWGGIQPPWIYSLMALHNEGYDLSHPVMAAGLNAL